MDLKCYRQLLPLQAVKSGFKNRIKSSDGFNLDSTQDRKSRIIMVKC